MKEDKKTRKKEEPELDMETTIADMNVEGFSWYNPAKKADAKSGNKDRVVLTKEEKRAIRRAALQAMIPFLLIIGIVFSLMYLLATLWLS